MSGLAQEFPKRVNGHNVDALSDEAKRECQTLGFKNHGLVIRSSSGDALWKQPDHSVNMDDVRTELRRLTSE